MKSRSKAWQLVMAGSLALWAAAPVLYAEGTEATPTPTAPSGGTPPLERKIPEYRHEYNDGLYSTLVAMLTSGAPVIKEQKTRKLKIGGFKKEIKVREILQAQPAPLVIVLVGVDGKADTPLGRLFPYWLGEAGANVLSFDSTFRPTYMEACKEGVTGNLDAEADQIVRIIAAYLKEKDVQGKFTHIGLVGYSMGGTQALIISRLAAQKKLPFDLHGCLAFSPLLRLKSSAAILDDMYATDRNKYTMIDMGKSFLTHEPVAPGAKIPFEPAFMRAGIGFLIREEFTEIVDRNDEAFRLKALPDVEKLQPGENRRSMAEVEWGFAKFIEKMSFPYWQKQGKIKSVDEMWQAGDLVEIMKEQPAFARAIVCENDPFNSPDDLPEVKKSANPKNLVTVPTGGHLGYVGSAWCYAHLMKLFMFK